MLDIGANVGAHTLPLASLVGPTGKLITFEPTAWAYDKLQRNIALNGGLADCMVAEQIMLVESAEDALPEKIMASWPVGPTPDEVHPLARGCHVSTKGAEAESLDGYLARHAVTRVDFVKMDVDGYECGVPPGASRNVFALPEECIDTV